MATKTGKMVIDPKSGEMVDEMQEDQMLVAVFDPTIEKPEKYTFQKVLRSNFTVRKLNVIFDCNVAYLRDPFGNVLWPKDWMTQVLPPKGKDKWFYIIYERQEPQPRDDLKDPMYKGSTTLLLTQVPKQCEEIDLKTWLLFGIAQEYAPLVQIRTEIVAAKRKTELLKEKIHALPSIEVDGTPDQQAEIRKKLYEAIKSHTQRFQQQLDALCKRRNRMEHLLMTEPLRFTLFPPDKTEHDKAADQRAKLSMESSEERVEHTRWAVTFLGSRGDELITAAMQKCDWNYVCLVATRPQPKAFLEDDQVAVELISRKDMAKEINMRTVRLQRLKHGEGEWMESSDGTKPWDEDFHISSISAMYAGEWRLGEKHGRGKEVTNVGIYEGDFLHNTRLGNGKMVYGKGTTVWGTFDRPKRTYEYSKKCQDKPYLPSLLNGDAFRDGIEHGDHMHVTFPDGATYEGEMRDGRITGFGRYTSSTGLVDEGFFLDGVLHGDHCRRQLPDGTIHEGTFVSGELDGFGSLTEKNGDQYDGCFERGVKHGRGISYFHQKQCKHVGFWHENVMDGRGDFYYSTGSHKEEDYDFWYEGSFVHGETKARHRHVDLKKQHAMHLPFTTNGKSSEKMPFLTTELPHQLAKKTLRRQKNRQRRFEREKSYLQKQEFANLTLYYRLLDEFYEKWSTTKRYAHDDALLDEEERLKVQAERQAMQEFERNREKFRKEKYDLSPRKRELTQFEAYLERISLTEQLALGNAVANESNQLLNDIKNAM